VPDLRYRSKGTDFTIECAKKYGKPCYIINYLESTAVIGIKDVISRLRDEQSVNIAGPRESEHPGAYKLCLALLTEAFALSQEAEVD
jgi:hypothetical protein